MKDVCATWETRTRAESRPQCAVRTRRVRESEGFVVPPMPGKPGGGKEPCFWVLSKERGIGGLA